MSPGPPPSAVAAHAELQALLATQRRRVVAHLARSLGLAHLALAEDAVQTAALRALEDWPVQGVPSNPAGWLYRSTANLAISRLRREGSFRSRFARLFTFEEAVTPEPEQKDEARRAMAVLGTLPDRQRVALSMKVLDGKSQREIADVLGLSEGYVSKLIDRAWTAVRAAGWEVPSDGSS